MSTTGSLSSSQMHLGRKQFKHACEGLTWNGRSLKFVLVSYMSRPLITSYSETFAIIQQDFEIYIENQDCVTIDIVIRNQRSGPTEAEAVQSKRKLWETLGWSSLTFQSQKGPAGSPLKKESCQSPFNVLFVWTYDLRGGHQSKYRLCRQQTPPDRFARPRNWVTGQQRVLYFDVMHKPPLCVSVINWGLHNLQVSGHFQMKEVTEDETGPKSCMWNYAK